MSEYVTDVNADIAKRSIRCFGTIIVRIDAVAPTVSNQLKNFLALSINYVTNEIIVALKDILRKYPEFINEFKPFFGRECLSQTTQASGRAAYIWILGRFGEQVDDAPYILEKIIEEEQEVGATHLQSPLVTACTQLFFKRAPEMKEILALLYKHVLKTSTDADLRQKVVFYFRLLK